MCFVHSKFWLNRLRRWPSSSSNLHGEFHLTACMWHANFMATRSPAHSNHCQSQRRLSRTLLHFSVDHWAERSYKIRPLLYTAHVGDNLVPLSPICFTEKRLLVSSPIDLRIPHWVATWILLQNQICWRRGPKTPQLLLSTCSRQLSLFLVTPWTALAIALIPAGFLQQTGTSKQGKEYGSNRQGGFTETHRHSAHSCCRAADNPWQRVATKQSRWYYIKCSMQRHSNLPHYWLASTSMITATGPRRIRITGTRPAIRPRQQNWSWP